MFDKHVVRLKSIEGLAGKIKQLCISSSPKDSPVTKLAAEVWKLYFA